MIGILILAQEDVAKGLLCAVDHVLGERPPHLDIQPIDYRQSPEHLTQVLAERLHTLDEGQGVLLLADIYGSSHTNAACHLLRHGQVELVSGVNLPMLIRVLNYRDLDLDELAQKALSGGSEGIVRAPRPLKTAEAGG